MSNSHDQATLAASPSGIKDHTFLEAAVSFAYTRGMSSKGPTLRETVQTILTRRIVSGEVPPDSTLPTEKELAEEFSVSRVVIREAMKVLAERGLIDIRQGRGTQVNRAEHWNPMDSEVLKYIGQGATFYTVQAELLEARMIFELQLAGLAATRMSDQDIAKLEGLLRRMDQCVNDPETYHLLDAEFHIAIVRGANNTILAKLLEPVHELLKAGFARTIRMPGAPQNAQVMHWAIYRAIKDRNPAQTQLALQRHLARAQENLLDLGEWLDAETVTLEPASQRLSPDS